MLAASKAAVKKSGMPVGIILQTIWHCSLHILPPIRTLYNRSPQMPQ